jgi:hypothetical protein
VRRFEFRLERVLKVKKQREWLAELRLKQARAVLDAAEAEVAALTEQVARGADALAARLGQPDDGSRLGRWQQSARLGDLLEAAEAKARAAAARYREAAAARTQIAAEVEALFFLRRQEWQEHRLALLRAGQEQLDEVGLRRWLAGQQDNSRTG